MKAFIDKLFAASKEAGFNIAEAYIVDSESFRAVSTNQEITEYASQKTRGLGFRAMLDGRVGYASTEAFDDAAVTQLVRGALDSARLCEDPSEQFLYDGKGEYPAITLDDPALATVTPEEKLDFALAMEKAARDTDPRVTQVGYNTIETGRTTVRIVNTLGLDREYTGSACEAFLQPVAQEGGSTVTAAEVRASRHYGDLDAKAIGEAAAKNAIGSLHAAPVASGEYRVIVYNDAMCDLMSTFCSVFSAEAAQKDLSLLKGKIGETIAAECVTIVDDPLRKDGLASRPFDGEGVPSRRNAVVEKGVFKTFLHNLKTARKDGVETTGNAARGGYAGSVRVAPSNFCIEPGKLTLDGLMAQMGDGLVITEMMGLHSGANAVSGDFSLLAKGYRVKGGKRAEPVEQITIAGNFFEMLKSIRAIGSDLKFPGGIGSASVDVGTLKVAGKE